MLSGSVKPSHPLDHGACVDIIALSTHRNFAFHQPGVGLRCLGGESRFARLGELFHDDFAASVLTDSHPCVRKQSLCQQHANKNVGHAEYAPFRLPARLFGSAPQCGEGLVADEDLSLAIAGGGFQSLI